MKNKLMICTMIVSLVFYKTTTAQSSTGQNNATEKSITVEGKKFPMTANEYNMQKAADNAKHAAATSVPQVPDQFKLKNQNQVWPDKAVDNGSSVNKSVPKPVDVNGTSLQAVPVKAGDNNIQSKPVSQASPAASQAVIQPLTQTIPAQSMKSSPVTQTPVGTVAVKPVVEAKSTNTGGLMVIPALTVATGNGTEPAVTVPQNKVAQQVVGQPKAAEVVVTPASVINPAPKSPVKE